MKKLDIVKEVRVIHVISCLLFVLAAVFLLAWPEIGTAIRRYLIGGCFVLFGLARLLGYFSNDLYRLAFQYDLGLGGFCTVFGVLSIISPDNIQMALPYTIGIYVLIDSLLKLQTAFDARSFGMKQWVGLLASSVLVSIAGILVLLGIGMIAPARILFGIALALDGAENIWNTLATVRVRVKQNSRFEELL